MENIAVCRPVKHERCLFCGGASHPHKINIARACKALYSNGQAVVKDLQKTRVNHQLSVESPEDNYCRARPN